MDKAQKLHYLKGGKFKAIYNPATLDISEESKNKIGKLIQVYQNCLNTPLPNGQFRFNSPSIHGYFPEEDIEIVDTLNEFIDFPEPTTKYCYRFTYTNPKTIFSNFGKGNFPSPLIVFREYNFESDEYVLKLSNPQADLIEKRVLNLLEDNEPEWETLFSV